MDPLGAAQALIGAVKYLYEITEKVKENKEEAARLCAHVDGLLKLIQAEYKDAPLPEKLDGRLAKLSA